LRLALARRWLVVLLLAAAACAPAPEPIAISGEHDGLVVEGSVSATGSSIAVDVVVRNERDRVIHLATDQCGRLTDVELERTVFRNEGQRWDGTIQAAKERVLNDQRYDDNPDSFAPRRVGDPSSAVPDCRRPDHAIALEPGGTVSERWELGFEDSSTLREVGSKAALVSIEAIEARGPAAIEYWDILYWADEDADREGRIARAELPLADVLDRPATEPLQGPTRGELFDRLLADRELRAWIEAQPADGWREGTLTPAYPDYGMPLLKLRLVTNAYERAALVEAQPDGSAPTLDLPGEELRTREYERVSGTLPPGIAEIPDSDYRLTEDLLVGEVVLPSGRLYVGEYLFDEEQLDVTVAPGAYPVHATLARYGDQDFDNVSFASIVFSDQPTVRWENAGTIAVDGGSTSIVSVEGRDALQQVMNEDEDRWLELQDRIFESVAAHDYLATEFDITPELNLADFSSGIGDGGYPVYVGFDAEGKPTRVVVDFYLLHLGWPDA
jgi:hypothetical protein